MDVQKSKLRLEADLVVYLYDLLADRLELIGSSFLVMSTPVINTHTCHYKCDHARIGVCCCYSR